MYDQETKTAAKKALKIVQRGRSKNIEPLKKIIVWSSDGYLEFRSSDFDSVINWKFGEPKQRTNISLGLGTPSQIIAWLDGDAELDAVNCDYIRWFDFERKGGFVQSKIDLRGVQKRKLWFRKLAESTTDFGNRFIYRLDSIIVDSSEKGSFLVATDGVEATMIDVSDYYFGATGRWIIPNQLNVLKNHIEVDRIELTENFYHIIGSGGFEIRGMLGEGPIPPYQGAWPTEATFETEEIDAKEFLKLATEAWESAGRPKIITHLKVRFATDSVTNDYRDNDPQSVMFDAKRLMKILKGRKKIQITLFQPGQAVLFSGDGIDTILMPLKR